MALLAFKQLSDDELRAVISDATATIGDRRLAADILSGRVARNTPTRAGQLGRLGRLRSWQTIAIAVIVLISAYFVFSHTS
jgi:hypothetical protein